MLAFLVGFECCGCGANNSNELDDQITLSPSLSLRGNLHTSYFIILLFTIMIFADRFDLACVFFFVHLENFIYAREENAVALRNHNNNNHKNELSEI